MTTTEISVVERLITVDSDDRLIAIGLEIPESLSIVSSEVTVSERLRSFSESIQLLDVFTAYELWQKLEIELDIRDSGIISQIRNGEILSVVGIYHPKRGPAPSPAPSPTPAKTRITDVGNEAACATKQNTNYPITTTFSCVHVEGLAPITLNSTPEYGNKLEYNLNLVTNETAHGLQRSYGLYSRYVTDTIVLTLKSDSERAKFESFIFDAKPYPIKITSSFYNGAEIEYIIANPVLEIKEIVSDVASETGISSLNPCGSMYSVELNLVRKHT